MFNPTMLQEFIPLVRVPAAVAPHVNPSTGRPGAYWETGYIAAISASSEPTSLSISR
jgi:hypothetical protein